MRKWSVHRRKQRFCGLSQSVSATAPAPCPGGMLVTPTKGKNTGRVGHIVHVEKHPGSFDIVSVKDATGVTFSTRLENIFVIGKGGAEKPLVQLPKGKGIKLSILQERDAREAKA